MLDIKVEGYREAVGILRQLSEQMQKKLLRQALRKSSRPIVQGAKSRAPKRTGLLRKSIRMISLLVFTGARGDKVFARSARGLSPNPFMLDAFNAASDMTVDVFGRELAASVEGFVNRNFTKR